MGDYIALLVILDLLERTSTKKVKVFLIEIQSQQAARPGPLRPTLLPKPNKLLGE